MIPWRLVFIRGTIGIVLYVIVENFLFRNTIVSTGKC